MSIKSRVRRLESSHNRGFVVAWPKYLSDSHDRIAWASDMVDDDIATIVIGELAFPRRPGEAFKDFERRACREAGEELKVSVWLHPSVDQI